MNETTRPIAVHQGVALVIGIVVGLSIFVAPAPVAGAAGGEGAALWLWALGGALSLIGALTYAELASAYPGRSGEYGFLQRAYGPRVAFLFGWARLAVIQTATIAAGGFVLGEYLNELAYLGPLGPAIYATLAVAVVTGVNLAGLHPSALAQTALAILLVGALATLAASGMFAAPAPQDAPPTSGLPALAAIGFAMIFVLYTFGGWNEAAYLSGEVARPQRDMLAILMIGVGAVTTLYMAVNWAYFHVLGFEAVAGADAVGFDLANATLGPAAGVVVTAFVVAAALSTMNATMFTGGRSAQALGRDWPLFAALAHWDPRRGVPSLAMLAQGGVALALIGLGAATKQGFETMVAYSAPVFWLFFLLSAASAIVLRLKEPARPRPFRMPFYPLPALVFCAAAGFMLWSSLSYAWTLMVQAAEGDAPVDGFAAGVIAGAIALGLGALALILGPKPQPRGAA